MNDLATASPPEATCEVDDIDFNSEEFFDHREHDVQSQYSGAQPKRVTEAEYWAKYYNNLDIIYEWNGGLLEEKAVSDKITTSMYGWLFEQVGYYLETYPVGERLYLETAFRVVLPHKTSLRRPDFGVRLHTNPVPYRPDDNSFQGVCNLCVEALSDLTPEDIKRDTQLKFEEYQAVGVAEYYILYSKGFPMEFYYLEPSGRYVPLPRADGIIRSKVLPGFQFRVADLLRQPSIEEMIEDPVYQGFVLPGYQQTKQRADVAEAQAISEQKARQAAEAQTVSEKQARQAAEQARQAAEAQAVSEKQARQAAEQARQAAEAQAVSEKQARQAAEQARQAAEDRIKLLEAELARLSKR